MKEKREGSKEGYTEKGCTIPINYKETKKQLSSRRKKINPLKKGVSIFPFDSMREQSKIMNEAIPPCPERWLNVPESSIIPDLPNIPPGRENHLPKERLVEIIPSMMSNFHHIITIFPLNLQIVPHANTKIALEKEVIFVLQYPSRTKNTFWSLINPPMPPLNHVLGVNPVHYNKPSKHLDRHSTATFPYPPQNGV